jgi:hypothetical protein
MLFNTSGIFCCVLMYSLSFTFQLLSGWGVERLVLPAVPELLETWTGPFGFAAMSNSDRFELAESSVLSFQGTTMCQKILNGTGHNPKDMSIQLVHNAEQMELGQNSIVSFERTTSNRSEEFKVTALTNYNNLELRENSIFGSWGTTIYQKVSSNAFSHPEELNGLSLSLSLSLSLWTSVFWNLIRENELPLNMNALVSVHAAVDTENSVFN